MLSTGSNSSINQLNGIFSQSYFYKIIFYLSLLHNWAAYTYCLQYQLNPNRAPAPRQGWS